MSTLLEYFCKNHGDQRFFQFEIIINVLASSFRFIWIPVMGIRPVEIYKFFQCGLRLYTSESDIYRCQILAYKDGPKGQRLIYTELTGLMMIWIWNRARPLGWWQIRISLAGKGFKCVNILNICILLFIGQFLDSVKGVVAQIWHYCPSLFLSARVPSLDVNITTPVPVAIFTSESDVWFCCRIKAVVFSIQIKRKQLTRTFIMISNWKKNFCLHGLYKNISALQRLLTTGCRSLISRR